MVALCFSSFRKPCSFEKPVILGHGCDHFNGYGSVSSYVPVFLSKFHEVLGQHNSQSHTAKLWVYNNAGNSYQPVDQLGLHLFFKGSLKQGKAGASGTEGCRKYSITNSTEILTFDYEDCPSPNYPVESFPTIVELLQCPNSSTIPQPLPFPEGNYEPMGGYVNPTGFVVGRIDPNSLGSVIGNGMDELMNFLEIIFAGVESKDVAR